mmetsp:Transcript_8351/g.12736  ORF Transcript_8351/g.12736 Transcript_8351/m.12736 type:complete len:410 (-) Transcript_8351:322-1551(-)
MAVCTTRRMRHSSGFCRRYTLAVLLFFIFSPSDTFGFVPSYTSRLKSVLPLSVAVKPAEVEVELRRSTRTGMLSTQSSCTPSTSQSVEDLNKSRDLTGLEVKPEVEDYSALKKDVIETAYIECKRITGIYAKTFYLGTKFLPKEKQQAVFAIYVWCRRTDDLVDSPRALMMGSDRLVPELEDWERRLDAIWNGEPADNLDLALWDTKQRYPDMDIEPFRDMIKGMLMDVPGLGQDRFSTFEELNLYCYRVAGTVGLMTLPIMGVAPGYTYEQAKEPALSLGVALQLTNIIRDVGEDALRGRIYLPQEDLDRFGVSESNILRGIIDDNYKAMLKFQIERARGFFKKAEEGIPMLAEGARMPVRASLDIYAQILDKVEENDYDNFKKRAYVTKTQKLLALPLCYLKTAFLK